MRVELKLSCLSLIIVFLVTASDAWAQGVDLGSILNGFVGGALRAAPPPYPRQYDDRRAHPDVQPRNQWGGQGTAFAPAERRSIAPRDTSAAGIANIGVGEFKLGGTVSPRALPQTFQCEPSHDFQGFTWCRRKTRDANGFTMVSMLLSPENQVSYVSKYVDDAVFRPGEVTQEIERLSDKFKTAARVFKPPQASRSPNAIIAVWGDVKLRPFGETELQKIAEGRTAGMGLLIDFMGDTKSSARQGLPVYRIEGGSGFFWIASQNGQSPGNLRFGAVDASSYESQDRPKFSNTAQSSLRSYRASAHDGSQPAHDVFKLESALSQEEIAPTDQLLEQFLMKTRPDLYTTDLDALNYYARQLPASSKQCNDLRTAEDDEVTIASAIDEARRVMSVDLEKARQLDPNILIRISKVLPVSEYVPSKSIIAFDKKQIKGSIVDSIAPFNWGFDRRDGTCLASPSPRALRGIPDQLLHQHTLTIKVAGGDRVKALNVDPETAKAIVRDIYNNPPRLSTLVRLGLIGTNVVGKVVSARATRIQLSNYHLVRPTAETVVIQEFPRSLFADVNVTTDTFDVSRKVNSSQPYIVSTEKNLKLNAIRLKPEYLSDGMLMRNLPAIIINEQSLYRVARTTNERPPAAIFEADQIVGREPSFAANELLPEFRQRVARIAGDTTDKIRSGIILSGGGLPYDFTKTELSLSRHNPLLLNPQRDGAIERNLDSARLKVAALRMVSGHILYQPSPVALDADQGPSIGHPIELTLQEINAPAVALDRLLLTPNLQLGKSEAEALAKALRGDEQVRSVVSYVIDGTSITDDKRLTLLGRVISVSILAPEGRELARYDASQFPPASVVTDAVQEQKALATSQEDVKRFNERAAQEAAVQSRKLDEANRAASLEQAKRDKEKQIVAAQERPEGGFGPAVAHIQLGMPIADAEQITRQSMKGAAVIKAEPGSWGFSPRLVSPEVFVSTDAGTIVSVTAYGDKSPRVVAVSQRVALPIPPISRPDLINLLNEKNGPPVDQYQNTLMWANNLNNVSGSCKQFADLSQNGFVLKEGTLSPMRGRQEAGTADQYANIGNLGYQTFVFVDERNAISQLRECPTTKIVKFDLNATDPFITTAVVDGGWLAKMIEDKIKKSEPADMSAVKALIDQ